MEKMKLNSKKIIVWLCVNYGIFVFAFFSLGLFGEKYRMVLWINFFLNVAICIISLILNIILFFTNYILCFYNAGKWFDTIAVFMIASNIVHIGILIKSAA